MKREMPFRFWDKVLVGDGCWEWQGGHFPGGYGDFHLDKKDHNAHRIAWKLWFNEDPGSLHVCHRCDNRPCVRPDHLFLGTRRDNMRDAWTKGRVPPPDNGYRFKSHCPHGHPYDEQNTYRRPDGGRECRACSRTRKAEYKRRLRKARSK